MTKRKLSVIVRCPWEKDDHRDPIVNLTHCFNCQFYRAHATNMTYMDCEYPEKEDAE